MDDPQQRGGSVCGVASQYQRLALILAAAMLGLLGLSAHWHEREGGPTRAAGTLAEGHHQAIVEQRAFGLRYFCAGLAHSDSGSSPASSDCPKCSPATLVGVCDSLLPAQRNRSAVVDCNQCQRQQSPALADTATTNCSATEVRLAAAEVQVMTLLAAVKVAEAAVRSGESAVAAAAAAAAEKARAAAQAEAAARAARVQPWQPTARDPLPPDGKHNGTLIVYCYYEANDKPAKTNLDFFLRVGVPQIINRRDVHLLFILMSESTVALPSGPRIFTHRRRNFGMDVCAYNETLPLIDTELSITGWHLARYKYFVWMNASVRGPFLPSGLAPGTSWLDYFVGQITPTHALVGTSINCLGATGPPDPGLPGREYRMMHLQSMFLVFPHFALPLLRKWLPCSANWEVTVYEGEVQFTAEVLRAGYGLVSQLLVYRGVDWRNADDANRACRGGPPGDLYFDGHYAGINISPLEVVFFKNNRANMDQGPLRLYTEWALADLDRHSHHGAAWPDPDDVDTGASRST